MSGIRLKIDRKLIKYPDSHHRTSQFQVEATNTSQDWVMMQIQVYAKGYPKSDDWYSIHPVVSAKEPPGNTIGFTANVLEPPILGIQGEIPLVVEVFSVENKHIFARQEVTLSVADPQSYIELFFEDNPILFSGQKNIVPVRVFNLSSKALDVQLECQNVPKDWEIHWENPNIKLFGKDKKVEKLFVTLPDSVPTPAGRSEDYQCNLVAQPKIGKSVSEKCQFSVAPQGQIELSSPEKEKTIREKIKSENDRYIFEYPLELTNRANAPQEIELSLENEGSRSDVDEFEFDPNPICLDRGASQTVRAIAKVKKNKRGWLIPKILEFEVFAQLKSPSPNIRLNRNSIVLILNLGSKWQQSLLLLLFLLLAVPFYQYLFPKRHSDTVNVVSIIDSGSRVLSGSRDRQIWQWRVNSTPERFLNPNALSYQGIVASKKQTASEVRVIRERAQSGAREVVVAAGLENGNIQLWNLSRPEKEPQWSLNATDSVFDLQFVQDVDYLLSAHGSGFVRQWNLDPTQGNNAQPEKQIYLEGVAVYALGITQGPQGKTLVAMGGQFNTLAFWDWENDRVYTLDPEYLQTVQKNRSQSDFLPIFGKSIYITSIAANDEHLVTADTQGYIKVWDMEVLRQCMEENAKPFQEVPSLEEYRYEKTEFSCTDEALQWQTPEPGRSVRSVAIASHPQNRQCFYLASTGDDGRVMLRSFSQTADTPKQQTVDFADTRLNTVDLILNPDKNEALIASDGDENRVRLHHHPIQPHADCQ